MILLEMIRLKGESIITIFSTDTKIIYWDHCDSLPNLYVSYSLLYLRVLTEISARTYMSVYAHLLWWVRRTYFVECAHLNWYLHIPFCKLQLKSVQTTAEVCTDFSRSLHKLRRGFENRKCNSYFFLVYLGIFMKPLACLFMYRKAIDDGCGLRADLKGSSRVSSNLASARLSYLSKNN